MRGRTLFCVGFGKLSPPSGRRGRADTCPDSWGSGIQKGWIGLFIVYDLDEWALALHGALQFLRSGCIEILRSGGVDHLHSTLNGTSIQRSLQGGSEHLHSTVCAKAGRVSK